MEGHERHDVSIGQRWHLLTIGHEPLCHIGPPTEKVTLDKALLRTWVSLEQYHDSMGSKCGGTKASLIVEDQGRRNKDFAGGARARMKHLKRQRWRSREVEVAVTCTERRRERSLFIREGGARGKPSAWIDTPAMPHHFASPRIMHTPPPLAPRRAHRTAVRPLDGPKTTAGK